MIVRIEMKGWLLRNPSSPGTATEVDIIYTMNEPLFGDDLDGPVVFAGPQHHS